MIPGKRRYFKDHGEGFSLNEGEYGLHMGCGIWFAVPPGFATGYANLAKHKVTCHDDGTITVSPSILVSNNQQTWHGYLEKGVWREV